jgi:hypothetical protein
MVRRESTVRVRQRACLLASVSEYRDVCWRKPGVPEGYLRVRLALQDFVQSTAGAYAQGGGNRMIDCGHSAILCRYRPFPRGAQRFIRLCAWRCRGALEHAMAGRRPEPCARRALTRDVDGQVCLAPSESRFRSRSPLLSRNSTASRSITMLSAPTTALLISVSSLSVCETSISPLR